MKEEIYANLILLLESHTAKKGQILKGGVREIREETGISVHFPGVRICNSWQSKDLLSICGLKTPSE